MGLDVSESAGLAVCQHPGQAAIDFLFFYFFLVLYLMLHFTFVGHS